MSDAEIIILKLRKRHAGLEARIKDEEGRPLPDHIRLSELKRKKLSIKDEIVLLQGTG